MFSWQNDVKIEVREGTDILRLATCIPCNQVIFDLPPEATPEAGAAETKKLMLHLELMHDCRIGVACDKHSAS